MKKEDSRSSYLIIVGNILEHYDNAIYAFLAPSISRIFLGERDPISSLLLLYMVPVFSLITRPLGALFFGYLGDRKGRKYSLFYSMTGLAIATFAIGCLPTYQEIGIYSFVALSSIKMLQTFFLSGENAGAAIFLLEKIPIKKRNIASSLYEASTIIGILLASFLCSVFHALQIIEKGWRVFFYLGGSTAIMALFFRFRFSESSLFLSEKRRSSPFSLYALVKEHKKQLLLLTCCCGLSYVTYQFAFIFMNVYAPLVANVDQGSTLYANTYLLGFDCLLLPLFGSVATKIGKKKLMFFSAAGLFLLGPFLFLLLDRASFWQVLSVRILLVTLGVAFSAPYYAWAIETLPITTRFTILSLVNAFAHYLGKPTTTICLWFYQKTGSTSVPGIYLSFLALGALMSLQSLRTPLVENKRRSAPVLHVS